MRDDEQEHLRFVPSRREFFKQAPPGANRFPASFADYSLHVKVPERVARGKRQPTLQARSGRCEKQADAPPSEPQIGELHPEATASS